MIEVWSRQSRSIKTAFASQLIKVRAGMQAHCCWLHPLMLIFAWSKIMVPKTSSSSSIWQSLKNHAPSFIQRIMFWNYLSTCWIQGFFSCHHFCLPAEKSFISLQYPLNTQSKNFCPGIIFKIRHDWHLPGMRRVQAPAGPRLNIKFSRQQRLPGHRYCKCRLAVLL